MKKGYRKSYTGGVYSGQQAINMGRVLIVMLVFFMTEHARAQQAGQNVTVQGTVTDASNGDSLIGVNIMVEGTTIGTSTNADGDYVLELPSSDAILVVSYIGYATREISVDGRTVIDIQMEPSSEALDQVVVTALGISREQQSLGYAVEEVSGDELNQVTQENVLNSLSGKMSGVSINATGGTASSSVSMVIRGATSLTGDDQPLFVIDGVPVSNSLSGNSNQFGDRNVVDYGNAISDLNASDIESVSVLKGASAAALYGSRAGNGVVLITTKSGDRNQDMLVSISTSTVFDRPYEYLKMHNTFATGVTPFTEAQWQELTGGPLIIDEGSAARLGPQLDIGQKAVQWNSPMDENGDPVPTSLVSHPDNIENFVQTGITNTNNMAISGGTDNSAFRVSYTNMNNRGIIPGSDLFRNSLNVNGTYFVSPSLSFNTNVNVGRTNSNNIPANNRGTNPLQAAYEVSSHINILDYKDYWVEGQEGIQQVAVPDHNNPYFMAHEVNNAFIRDRVFGRAGADWKISPTVSVTASYSLDRFNEQRETEIPYSYTRNPQGTYGIQKINRTEHNTSVSLDYNQDFTNFSLRASAGGNYLYRYNSSTSNSSSSGGLTIPGLYNLSNIAPEDLDYGSSWSQKAIYSAYGLASLGYKNMLYVDVTARNDWSSTLPVDNRSYFYPSVSTSAILSNMFNMGGQVDMIKLRAGWAQVGNDTDPYRLEQTLYNAGAWGDVTRLGTPGTLLTPDLKPEIITSVEVGTEWVLFGDRFRFEGTYYETDNENQILPLSLPQSSGYGSKLINAGLVSSRGVELSVGSTVLSSRDSRFDVDLNYTYNRARIEELAEGIDYYKFWTDAKGGAFSWVGEDIGNIYDRELVTVEDPNSPYYGWPVLDESGSWQSRSGVNDLVKIGNFNPDFTIGLQTSFSYQNFTFSANVDWRQGGEFVSQTYRYQESDWSTQRQLDEIINPDDISGDMAEYLKNNAGAIIVGQTPRVGGPTPEMGGYEFNYEGIPVGSGTFNPGVIAEYDEEGNLIGYTENLGGPGTRYIPMADNYPWDFTKTAMFDASFVKLREVSMTYRLPQNWTERLNIGMNDMALTLYSRNIILWTKAKIGIDPERAFQPEGNGFFKQGIERYNVMPFVLPVGVKLSANF
ncbi:SusC/RagA family TonB-linked outer membrane protein [Fodinibius sediminis]|uniref:TonB-linked outer membrane protein, SusC/RagA family n=1 Tax=Fodinibius sediminis TaxID=1214077 RepID=A0A521BU14_9BACT|nr:SusC/RagA family TonB-linked outer membrane protein [Fodinibius sediminis]SMO50662.1 TonB-linked outer membrane protein, SusC/RagA family [Fodinibius sediminis]